MKKLYLTEGGYNGPNYLSMKDLKHYSACCSETDDVMSNFWEKSIFDAWSSSSELFIPNQDGDPVGWEIAADNLSFNFNEFEYSGNRFEATFNNDKNGYDIIFHEDYFHHLDKYALQIFLSVDEKKDRIFLHKDDKSEKMTSEQKSLIDDFINQVNKLKEHYAQ